MDNIKKIDSLVLKLTSDSLDKLQQQYLHEVISLVSSRVDMPKYVIASISKRMAIKNKNVLTNIFNLLEYLVYNCELSLYTQISTKQFLFKISGILTNKEIDKQIKNKILQTLYCCEQLFRPHEDLLPMFFQFYAGVLRNGFDIPYQYRSVFRPVELKQYKKHDGTSTGTKSNRKQKNKNMPAPSISEQKTFEEIRQKLILTNQIIDNSNPSENFKQNALLLEMIDQIKECQKRVNQQQTLYLRTINENPNQNIMEMALAANDDIFITYRRFKDLQRNRKPQPFILTELASEVEKENQYKRRLSQIGRSSIASPTKLEKKQVNILDFDQPQSLKKVQPAHNIHSPQKNNVDLFDMDLEPQTQVKIQPKQEGNLFDLLGQALTKQNLVHSQFPVAPQQQSQLLYSSYSHQNSQNQQNQQNQFLDLIQQQQQQHQHQHQQHQQQQYQQHQQLNPLMGAIDLLMSTQNYQQVFVAQKSELNLENPNYQGDPDLKNKQKSTDDKFDDLTFDFLKK